MYIFKICGRARRFFACYAKIYLIMASAKLIQHVNVAAAGLEPTTTCFINEHSTNEHSTSLAKWLSVRL